MPAELEMRQTYIIGHLELFRALPRVLPIFQGDPELALTEGQVSGEQTRARRPYRHRAREVREDPSHPARSRQKLAGVAATFASTQRLEQDLGDPGHAEQRVGR